jgi:hypothetical protein
VAAAQVLLLCWFCLFLAVRHTAEERRPDIGMLKLRGASRWRVWALTVQQSGLPMLAGAVCGLGPWLPAALALVRWNSAGVPLADGGLLSVAAAAVAVLGALAGGDRRRVALARHAVTGLLRRVPSRRSGWRADAVDLVVVLVALAGIYQAWSASAARSTRPPSRCSRRLSWRWPSACSGRGRCRCSRREWAPHRCARGGRAWRWPPSTWPGDRARTGWWPCSWSRSRCSARPTLAWQSSDAAAHRRATQELGAARVLTVTADTTDRVLNAVRTADPDGRYAMAAARVPGGTNVGLALAVDATRSSGSRCGWTTTE